METDTSGPIAHIDVDTLAPLLESGAVLIDVRTPPEYDEVRVPGARLVPLAELPDRWGEIPDADVVYVVCRSGGRSLTACDFLAARGRQAVNVAGGTTAWATSGRPTESGPGSA